AEVNAFTYDFVVGSDVLVLDVVGRPNIPSDQLEHEVAREVDLLLANGVSPAEVHRAVTLIETEYTKTFQSAGERADKLSMFATYFGDPNLVNAQVGHYRSVTSKAVNAFIKERLGENNRASLLYVPRGNAPVRR